MSGKEQKELLLCKVCGYRVRTSLERCPRCNSPLRSPSPCASCAGCLAGKKVGKKGCS